MPLEFVSGDPMLTTCQTLAIGHNRAGRTEMDDCSLALMRKFPAAYATYGRRCKQNRQASGDLFLWTQSVPQLLFMTVRDNAVGATRLRHVQCCLMTIARDYRLYHIRSLAIAPFSSKQEWADIKTMLSTWFEKTALNVTVYEDYESGVIAQPK